MIHCLDSVLDSLNNNKQLNEVKCKHSQFYVARTRDQEHIESLQLIQILKNAVGKDVKIGANVRLCIFELRPKLSVRRLIDKNSLILFEKNRKSRQKKMHDNRVKAIQKNKAFLKSRHVVMVASDEVLKLRGDELYTYEDVLGIVEELNMNRVSTLFGGFKEYLLKKESAMSQL